MSPPVFRTSVAVVEHLLGGTPMSIVWSVSGKPHAQKRTRASCCDASSGYESPIIVRPARGLDTRLLGAIVLTHVPPDVVGESIQRFWHRWFRLALGPASGMLGSYWDSYQFRFTFLMS